MEASPMTALQATYDRERDLRQWVFTRKALLLNAMADVLAAERAREPIDLAAVRKGLDDYEQTLAAHNTRTNQMHFRRHFYSQIESVTQVKPGHFVVEHASHGSFLIEGGKYLGGSRSDWFLSGAAVGQNLPCKSVSDALRLIEGV